MGGMLAPARATADAIASREACHKRLQKVAQAHASATQSWPDIQRELIDCLVNMRILSLQVVEAIVNWRQHGKLGAPWPDPQTGENYMLKMRDDTRWLADSPFGEILRFSPKADPFFVVPSASGESQHPTNQMTPTLKAQHRLQCRSGSAERRRAVLPLQGSLLRRIRVAELLILKDAVQSRVHVPEELSPSVPTKHHVPLSVASAASAAYMQGLKTSPGPASPTSEAVPKSPSIIFASKGTPIATFDSIEVECRNAVPLAPSKARPPQPAEQDFEGFRLVPINILSAKAADVFSVYQARIDPRVVQSLDSCKRLVGALEDEGACAPEWFWFLRENSSSGADSADGLVIFRLQRTLSALFGQLLHVSTVDPRLLAHAIGAAKARMFAWLPIRAVKVTLWSSQVDGEYQKNTEFESVFKQTGFRWSQLLNEKGSRGTVFKYDRKAPDPDTVAPLEQFGVEVCVGQVWLRGCSGSHADSIAVAGNIENGCPSNLVLASACLRQMWDADAAATAAARRGSMAAGEFEANIVKAREGIVRALLAGTLDEALARFRPVSTVEEASAGSRKNPAGLAVNLAGSLSAGPKGRSVPDVMLANAAGGELAAGMVKCCIETPGYSEAVEGLGLDQLPGYVESLQPREAVFGRLLVTLNWLGCSAERSDGSFDVPVQVAASSEKHPHPVFYCETPDKESYVVIIPWAVPASDAPSEDEVFAVCTEVMRSVTPLGILPYQALRFAAPFDVRYAPRITEIKDPVSFKIAPPLVDCDSAMKSEWVPSEITQVLEFSSLTVGPGRLTPGRLSASARPESVTFKVDRPFAFCIWNAGIDDLNAPLSATFVR